MIHRVYDALVKRYVYMSFEAYLVLLKIITMVMVAPIPILILSVMRIGLIAIPFSFGVSLLFAHWVIKNMDEDHQNLAREDYELEFSRVREEYERDQQILEGIHSEGKEEEGRE